MVDAFGPAEFEHWREQAIIPRLFEVRTEPETFFSAFQRRAFGSTLLLRYDTAAASFLRTAERARRDGVDHVWVQLLQSGGLEASSGSLSTSLRPREGGFCDLGRAVEQTSREGAGLVFMTPRGSFPDADRTSGSNRPSNTGVDSSQRVPLMASARRRAIPERVSRTTRFPSIAVISAWS